MGFFTHLGADDLDWAQLVDCTSSYRPTGHSDDHMALILLVPAVWSGNILFMAMAAVQEVSLACITYLTSTSPTARLKSQGFGEGIDSTFLTCRNCRVTWKGVWMKGGAGPTIRHICKII